MAHKTEKYEIKMWQTKGNVHTHPTVMKTFASLHTEISSHFLSKCGSLKIVEYLYKIALLEPIGPRQTFLKKTLPALKSDVWKYFLSLSYNITWSVYKNTYRNK